MFWILYCSIIVWSISLARTQSSCSYGLKPCEYYPWAPWAACNSTCGGFRYRMKPLCCTHTAGQQQSFDECLQSCNVTRSVYFKTQYEEQLCDKCSTHGKLCAFFFLVRCISKLYDNLIQ